MSASNKAKITRLLQQSILELCKVTLPTDEACDIDGILCVTLGKVAPIDYVVKIHESLEPHITIKTCDEDVEDCQTSVKDEGAFEEKDKFEEKPEAILDFKEDTVQRDRGTDFKENSVHEEAGIDFKENTAPEETETDFKEITVHEGTVTENENYEGGMFEDDDDDDDEGGYMSGVDYLDADSMDVVDERRQTLEENNLDAGENEADSCTPVREDSNSQEDGEAADDITTDKNVGFSSVIGQIIFKHEEENSLASANNVNTENEKCERVEEIDETGSNVETEATSGETEFEESGIEKGDKTESLKNTENNQMASDVNHEIESELNDSKDNILMNETNDNMETNQESEADNQHAESLENEMDDEDMGCLVEITEANQENMDYEQSDMDSNKIGDPDTQQNETAEKELENDPSGAEEAEVQKEKSIKEAVDDAIGEMTQAQSIQEQSNSGQEPQNASAEETEVTPAENNVNKSQLHTEMNEAETRPVEETITGGMESSSDVTKESETQSNVESMGNLLTDSQQNFTNESVHPVQTNEIANPFQTNESVNSVQTNEKVNSVQTNESVNSVQTNESANPVQTIVVTPEARPPRPESVMIVGQTPPKRAKSTHSSQVQLGATSVISSPVASMQQNRPVVSSASMSSLLVCNICEVEMPNTGALKEHYESFHLLHVCDVCSATFKHKINYDLHIITHEKARQNRDVSTPIEVNKHLKCGICGSVFNQPAALYDHIRTSHDFQTFLSCILCGEFFPNYHTFGYHRKSAHSAIKEIVCKFCKNGFAQKEIARHRVECNKPIPQQGAYMDLMSLAEKASKVNKAKNDDVEILGVEMNNSIRTPNASPSRQSITPFKSPQATPPKTWMNSQRSPMQRSPVQNQMSPVQQYPVPMSPVRQRVPPSPGRRRGAYNQSYSPIPKTVGDMIQAQQQQNRVQQMQAARYASPGSVNIQQSPQRGRRGYDTMQQMSPSMRTNIMNRFPTSPQNMNQVISNQYPAPGRVAARPRFHASQTSPHPYQRSPQRQRPRNIPGEKGSKETPINLDPEEEITIVEPAKKRQQTTPRKESNSTAQPQGSSGNLTPQLQMALNNVLSKLLKPGDQQGTTQDNNTAASPLKISSVYSVNPPQSEDTGQPDPSIQDPTHSNPSDLPQPIVQTETDGQVIDIRPQTDSDMNQPKPPFMCQLCKHSFTDFRAFVKHNSNIHFRSVCSFCGDTFSDATSMAQHMAEHMSGSGAST